VEMTTEHKVYKQAYNDSAENDLRQRNVKPP
jgi:hypothetical protein